MDTIDFRSDTVSWPTAEMRQAMAAAPVGDDVYGEDPTVNQLEATAADMLGHEAGLFVSSGTQGNLICMMTHATRGDEAIIGRDAHVFEWEAGGMAQLGGIVPRPLPTDDIGRLDVDEVRTAVRGDNPHWPRSRLICTENSSGGNYGAAIPPAYFVDLRTVADEHELALHLDGARLFNAAVALGVDVRQLTASVDSVSVCLSKGLCAPVGSIVVGSRPFIHRARRMRKVLGGGMRQAGVLAAAGLIALRTMTRRLDEDHAHARLLAELLADLPGIHVDVDRVRTNMVFFNLTDEVDHDPAVITAELEKRYNIRLGGYRTRGFRAVTHYWIREQDVRLLADGLRQILTN